MKKYLPALVVGLVIVLVIAGIWALVYSVGQVISLKATVQTLDYELNSTVTSSPGIAPYVNTCISVGYCPTVADLLQKLGQLQALQQQPAPTSTQK